MGYLDGGGRGETESPPPHLAVGRCRMRKSTGCGRIAVRRQAAELGCVVTSC